METMRDTRRRGLEGPEDCSAKWSGMGQNRLDRLLELRAVVDYLRAERAQELRHYLQTQRERRLA